MGGPRVTLTHNDIGVWVINLDQDTSRRNAMESQLKSLGLPFKRFAAINGKDHYDTLLKRADEKAYSANMGSKLLSGKLGVFASHTSVWQEFIASDHEIALILEDDVVFHDDFLESLDLALAARAHWDTVRFNCIRAKLPVSQGVLGKYQLNLYLGPFTGNAAYLINKTTAKRILPNLWPQTRALDHELNLFFKHNFRQCGLEPFSSHVDDGDVSSITGANFALVKKPCWTKRLPHYRLKAANYFRRGAWILRNGYLPSRRNLL